MNIKYRMHKSPSNIQNVAMTIKKFILQRLKFRLVACKSQNYNSIYLKFWLTHGKALYSCIVYISYKRTNFFS